MRAERRLLSVGIGSVSVCALLAVSCGPKNPMGRPTGKAPVESVSNHTPPPVSRGESTGRLSGPDRVAMIALSARAVSAPVSSTGGWRIEEQGGRAVLVRGGGTEPWRIEQRGTLLRVAGDGNDATPWREGPFVARSESGNAVLSFEGRKYRGELLFTPTDSGILVVNRLNVEEYLRGVVPLELGTRSEIDRAALEAQAIAARSYTYSRVPSGNVNVPVRGFHMVSTVSNQVYGGVNAEHPVVDAAIRATAGLVLRYQGSVVDAPYHSSCGGQTAAPREAWRTGSQESYLRSVSDINETTGRPWCEISPRHSWTAEFDEAQLTEVARRALVSAGMSVPRNPRVRSIAAKERLASGRLGEVQIETDAGNVSVKLSDIRNVFRDARGAILSSTYFSVDRVTRGRGHLTSATLRGAGNGHGVGMCQWGAMGRARAGQDARTILRHYYPGTVVGFAD